MSFILSKLFWALANPASELLLLVLVALLLHQRRPKTSRILLSLVVAILAAASLFPIGRWAIRPLEQRFPITDLPAHVDGVVVLGGAIEPTQLIRRFQPTVNDAAERITTLLVLSRLYPNARLVYSGGSGFVFNQTEREADQVGPLLTAMGVDPARVILERESRNTWENAVDSKRLVNPKPGETWLLVTSAWHMPRSMGCFRKVGWKMVPYPVDYRGSEEEWFGFGGLDQLQTAAFAEKEWIGLLSYHLMGRTDSLFPRP